MRLANDYGEGGQAYIMITTSTKLRLKIEQTNCLRFTKKIDNDHSEVFPREEIQLTHLFTNLTKEHRKSNYSVRAKTMHTINSMLKSLLS